MLSYLTENQVPLGRVEIPFTRDHWEAKYVAEKVPLARGWDRQIDLSRNAVLYAPLTAASYHTWLYENAVRFVALPDAPLDQGGQAEKALLKHPPSYLRSVYTDNQWHIWAVVGAAPLASGAATMTIADGEQFHHERADWRVYLRAAAMVGVLARRQQRAGVRGARRRRLDDGDQLRARPGQDQRSSVAWRHRMHRLAARQVRSRRLHPTGARSEPKS